MDFNWLEGVTVDSVVAFNVFWSVVQCLIALPFLRRYHQKTTSPFGFHPFKRLGTAEERHTVYRYGALWLLITGLPQIPFNILCLYLPHSYALAAFLFIYPFFLFGLALLFTFFYALRVAARGRRARKQAQEAAPLDTSA